MKKYFCTSDTALLFLTAVLLIFHVNCGSDFTRIMLFTSGAGLLISVVYRLITLKRGCRK